MAFVKFEGRRTKPFYFIDTVGLHKNQSLHVTYAIIDLMGAAKCDYADLYYDEQSFKVAIKFLNLGNEFSFKLTTLPQSPAKNITFKSILNSLGLKLNKRYNLPIEKIDDMLVVNIKEIIEDNKEFNAG